MLCYVRIQFSSSSVQWSSLCFYLLCALKFLRAAFRQAIRRLLAMPYLRAMVPYSVERSFCGVCGESFFLASFRMLGVYVPYMLTRNAVSDVGVEGYFLFLFLFYHFHTVHRGMLRSK